MTDLNQYLRVTEVIAPFSGVEFVPKDLLQMAADRGTLVHDQIENFLSPLGIVEQYDHIDGYMKSFYDFWESWTGKDIIAMEERLFCDEKMITGKFDLLCRSGDSFCILDWKTSSKPQKKSWRLQAAGYRYLASSKYDVDQVIFVNLKKNGLPATLHKFDTYEEDLGTFFKCLDLYKYFEMETRGSR